MPTEYTLTVRPDGSWTLIVATEAVADVPAVTTTLAGRAFTVSAWAVLVTVDEVGSTLDTEDSEFASFVVLVGYEVTQDELTVSLQGIAITGTRQGS